MMNKNLYRVVGIFVLSMMVCSVGFALDIPDGVTRDPAMSDGALALAQQQFTMLKQQLTGMAQSPSMPPEQQTAINGAIAVIEDKLQRLDRVDVYFAAEDTPGEAYGSVYDFYKNNLSMMQDVSGDEVEFAVTQVPQGMIPQPTMDSLMALLAPDSGYDVKGATGTSGKSRVSILTVYLNPTTFELIKGTTVVIATDK